MMSTKTKTGQKNLSSHQCPGSVPAPGAVFRALVENMGASGSPKHFNCMARNQRLCVPPQTADSAFEFGFLSVFGFRTSDFRLNRLAACRTLATALPAQRAAKHIR
jgi:hypothetical protein